MIAAADRAVQRPAGAKLLAIDGAGHSRHLSRRTFADLLRPGDLLVANDAATLPASLSGVHVPSGMPVEVRLAGWRSVNLDVAHFTAVVFGAGDYRIRTEDRPLPPVLAPGDRLALGPLTATISDLLGHPRLIALNFDGASDDIWAGLARHGRPIQYAHITSPLALWDAWTVIAGRPVAFEPPSAGFALDWRTLALLPERGIGFATITLAAGISSTGDDELDRRLPLDEPYEISEMTAAVMAGAHARGARVVAVGTTVVRALEEAVGTDGVVHAGRGMATERIDHTTDLHVVDAILTGVHLPGTSHYELLRAFADEATLLHADAELNANQFCMHEFGDSVFLERRSPARQL